MFPIVGFRVTLVNRHKQTNVLALGPAVALTMFHNTSTVTDLLSFSSRLSIDLECLTRTNCGKSDTRATVLSENFGMSVLWTILIYHPSSLHLVRITLTLLLCTRCHRDVARHSVFYLGIEVLVCGRHGHGKVRNMFYHYCVFSSTVHSFLYVTFVAPV